MTTFMAKVRQMPKSVFAFGTALAMLAGGSAALWAQVPAPGFNNPQIVNYKGDPNDMESDQTANLQDDPSYMIMKQYAKMDDRIGETSTLEYLQAFIENGKKNEEMVDLLRIIAWQGIQDRNLMNGDSTIDFPDLRAKAVQLMGECGGKNVREYLVKVFETDKEPNVRYEVINALAKQNVGDDPYILARLNMSFHRMNFSNPDNRTAMALLNLYSTLYDQGKLTDPANVGTIMEIYENPGYTYPVRHTAALLLNKMRGQSDATKESADTDAGK
jgi:hypothetical protein